MLSIITSVFLFGSSFATYTPGVCGDAQIPFDYHYFNSLANNTIKDLNSIFEGQKLILPRGTFSIASGDNVRRATVQEGDTLSKISEKFYLNVKYSNRPTNYYLIQSGDTLSEIAALYVPYDYLEKAISDLVALNSIEDANVIREGVILVLPQYFMGSTGIKGSVQIIDCASGDEQIPFDFHYFNSMADNSIQDLNSLSEGQTFLLPKYACSAATGNEVSNVTIKAGDTLWHISKNYYLNVQYAYRPTKHYLIQKGDTLSTIAASYVPVEDVEKAIYDLISLNAIENSNAISEGVILTLPEYFTGRNGIKGSVNVIDCFSE